MDGFSGPGTALAAFMLSITTMAKLKAKGLLSPADRNEIIEHALLALETYQHTAGQSDQPAFAQARQILDGFRQGVSLADSEEA